MIQRERELLREALPHLPEGQALAVRQCLWQAGREAKAPELESLRGRQRQKARRVCDQLFALPPERQAERVRRTRGLHASEPLAQELLRRSRQALPEDPPEALRRAELAWEVTFALARRPELCGGRRGLLDLNARVLAGVANAYRVAHDWRRAEGAFGRAFHLLEVGTLDPILEAEVLSPYGSYLRNQLRFEEAVAVLERAADLSRNFAAPQLQARSLLKLATVFGELGKLDNACAANLRAWKLIDEAAEPRLVISAWHNQIKLCVMAERYKEAEHYLEEAPAVYAHWHIPADNLACAWVRGLVAQGLGHFRQAERHLVEAMRGFFAMKGDFEAALVALDLAALLLEQGRHHELIQIAEAAYTRLSRQGLHQDAEKALVLLLESARRRQVTLELVRQAAAALRKHPSGGPGGQAPQGAPAPRPLPALERRQAPEPASWSRHPEASLPLRKIEPYRFGRALRWLRFYRGVRFEEVAERAGITLSMLNGYERGWKRPRAATLERVLSALGAEREDLRAALFMVPGTEFPPGLSLPIPEPLPSERFDRGFDLKLLDSLLKQPDLAAAADKALRRLLAGARAAKTASS